MTTSGEPPLGAGGVSEPDWIDQILEQATNEADSRPPPRRAAPPIVPDRVDLEPRTRAEPVATPPPVGPEPLDGLGEIRWVDTDDVRPASTPIVASEPSVPAPVVPWTAVPAAPASLPIVGSEPIVAMPTAATTPVNQLQVTPASTPIVPPATSAAATAIGRPDATELLPQAVGRSAWDADLATVGDSEPEGWDKLSWQDLDESQSIETNPLQEQTSFGRLLREWGPVLFTAIVIALVTRLLLVQAYHIPSESMVPTLEAGDRVVVNRLSYTSGEVQRGQVVVFSKPSGTEGENDLIKRVMGLPGETIRFVDNQVYIDDLRVEEPYLLTQNSTRPRLMIPGCAQEIQASDLCVIPEGHVFMMGDNRQGSSDSRVFGPIPVESIVGRAFMRVWPLNNVGQL